MTDYLIHKLPDYLGVITMNEKSRKIITNWLIIVGLLTFGGSLFAQPGHGHGGGMGDWDMCDELTQEDCELMMMCDWDAELGECGFSEGMGDWDTCEELTQEDCELMIMCEWDVDEGECGFSDGMGDCDMCDELTQED
jgi:hypothetical protein